MDGDQQTSVAAMQGRGRGIRVFVEQLRGEREYEYEGLPAHWRKISWRFCRRLETGSRHCILANVVI